MVLGNKDMKQLVVGLMLVLCGCEPKKACSESLNCEDNCIQEFYKGKYRSACVQKCRAECPEKREGLHPTRYNSPHHSYEREYDDRDPYGTGQYGPH